MKNYTIQMNWFTTQMKYPKIQMKTMQYKKNLYNANKNDSIKMEFI